MLSKENIVYMYIKRLLKNGAEMCNLIKCVKLSEAMTAASHHI